MKVATWNVNSIRARRQHVIDWLDAAQPDVLCLQELKVTDTDFPYDDIRECGYEAAVSGQKTYNGVAILSRHPIADVVYGLGDDEDDPQARLISGRIKGVTVLSAYFPNGGEVGSDKYEYKLRWMTRLGRMLARRFDPATDELALCGDFNVAPWDDDIGRLSEWRSSVLACEGGVSSEATDFASTTSTARPSSPSAR
jgi:exodeoxyribonuclease-3